MADRDQSTMQAVSLLLLEARAPERSQHHPSASTACSAAKDHSVHGAGVCRWRVHAACGECAAVTLHCELACAHHAPSTFTACSDAQESVCMEELSAEACVRSLR